MTVHAIHFSSTIGPGVAPTERSYVEVYPAFEFAKDSTVNWPIAKNFEFVAGEVTVPGLEDTASDGTTVSWVVRHVFTNGRGGVVGGAGPQAFQFKSGAGVTVEWTDSTAILLVDVVVPPEFGPTFLEQTKELRDETASLLEDTQQARDDAAAFAGTNNAQVAGMVTADGLTKTALSATNRTLVSGDLATPASQIGAAFRSGTAAQMTETGSPLEVATRNKVAGALIPATQPLKPMVNYAVGGDSNAAYNGGSNWSAMLCTASYGRVRRVGVFAAGGYTLQQWRDLLMPNLLALSGRDKVQLLSLMLGTNNVGDELGKLRADYEAVLDTLAANGILVAVHTIPPRMDSAASKAWAQQWNAILVQIAYERDLPLLDVYAALVDPATGDFKAGYYPAGETIHFFTVAGQMAVARALRPAFLNIISRVHPRFAKANTSADNLAANALMMTGGGKFNGVNNVAGYAQGWQSNAGLTIASGAPSLYTDAAGQTWQRFKDVDTTLILSQTWINIAPGHRYEVLLKLRALGFTGADASTYTVDVAYVNAATVKAGLVGYQPPIANESPASPTDETDYLVSRFEGVAPSDALQIRVTVTITKGAGTLVGKTVDYTGLTVTDLTKAERTLTDAVTAAGSPNLTSAKAAFTNADIGKTINVYGAGTGGTILTTTIASVTSATVAVMAANAVVAVPVAKLLIAPVV